jgi:hypothetical protein
MKGLDQTSDFIKIINATDLSDMTKASYVARIKQLESRFKKQIYLIIKDAKVSLDVLKAAYPTMSSLKMYLVLILSLFKHVPDLRNQLTDAHKIWSESFAELDKAIDTHLKKNKPSARQAAGYVPYKDIIAKRDTLPKGSIERLLIGMYTYIYPLRSDFNMVSIYKTMPNKPTANYILMGGSGCKLVLNEYKTSKRHGQFEKELPHALCDEINASLLKQPRAYLFVTIDGHPFDLPHSFTNFANRTFKKIFGKPLTISIIRHSFIMTLDFNKMTIEEKERIAAEMCHTAGEQDQYRLIFNSA